MSNAVTAAESALLSDLEARILAAGAKVTPDQRTLAGHLLVRWLALHIREAAGESEASLLPEAREVAAMVAVLEAVLADLARSAAEAWAIAFGAVVGKVALAALKGAVPGAGAVL